MSRTDTREQLAIGERQTVELCGDEPHKGVRCILPRGHACDHEARSTTSDGAITWQRAN